MPPVRVRVLHGAAAGGAARVRVEHEPLLLADLAALNRVDRRGGREGEDDRLLAGVLVADFPAADAAARKLVAPAADVAAVRTLACPAIGFFRSVPFPRADDTLLSEALAFEVSIFNGAAFLGAPPRGDAARAGGAFRGDPARGTPDVPSALGDIVSRGRPQGFAR